MWELTDNCQHGCRALIPDLHFDHGRVINSDFLKGQRVDLSVDWHVDDLAGMQADVVFVPHHGDVVVGQL